MWISTVMACWLECVYHTCCSPSVSSIACVISGNENNIYAGTNNDDNNDNDADNNVAGPTVLAYVNLARTVGK